MAAAPKKSHASEIESLVATLAGRQHDSTGNSRQSSLWSVVEAG